ncbi:hypothetical protein Pmar_PMAR019142 [Perkinsus marinus ATCC 50983]|uniref:Ion transport domain-containing protein n=1 Tax=Perkinsus marinus (strain ATCC 50983 / TXsc) TaxID=423536 RepID=C5KTZ5_PERM5|nr:hypothetical protein Pmar_PMAR019142 [Perkinsus marinus ATCC 50983]EER12037.1 hypothetical protein Pmar_PMAR019142 [Perkinsus marinus ATCC 50983]|eukprot:XP_002780242.1 hypothetical protein Pmar_PMAR019142 [Perkinsus marinus ATCC 50983]
MRLQNEWVRFCSVIVDKAWFSATTTILTLYALFGDDIRMACFEQDADSTFNAITIACLVVFGIEIILQSFGKPDYFGGFFFLLDVLATGSLVLDLTYVAEDLFGDDSGTAGQGDAARAGRMSRAGTRAGRIVRIIRLIRLIRIAKMYKAFVDAQQREARVKNRQKQEELALEYVEEEEEEEEEEEGESFTSDDQSEISEDFLDDDLDLMSGVDEEIVEPESRVGKKLTEKTTQKLIVASPLLLSPYQFSIDCSVVLLSCGSMDMFICKQ